MLTDEERQISQEMLEANLAPETIATLLQRRRSLPSQPEKAALWRNFKALLDDVVRFREQERKRHGETDPRGYSQFQDRYRW